MPPKRVLIVVLLMMLVPSLPAAGERERTPPRKEKKAPRVVKAACFDTEGNPTPCNDDSGGSGSGGGAGGCVGCSRDPVTMALSCDNSAQRWNPCRAQYVCYYTPGSGYQCVVDCGDRCFSV